MASPPPRSRRVRWPPLLIAAALWLGLPLHGCWEAGITGVEKVLTAFALPVGLLWNVAVLATLWRWYRGRLRAAVGSFLMVLAIGLIGNGYVGGLLAWLIEPPRSDWTLEQDGPFDAIVLLGGSTRHAPGTPPELNDDGQRLFYAAQLYHAGVTPRIIATGGGSVFDPRALPYARHSRILLEAVGVPSEAIVEVGGVNTRQEMRDLTQWFEVQGDSAPQDVGLITNAAHVPRAMRLARRHGLDFEPLPCAHRGGFGDWRPTSLIPTASGIERTTDACYEILARLAGQ